MKVVVIVFALLGLVGTVLAVMSLVPHLVLAIRAGGPGGSWRGWLIGASASATWLLLGIDSHNAWMIAANLITLPIGVTLGVWAFARRARHAKGQQPLAIRLAVTERQRVDEPALSLAR